LKRAPERTCDVDHRHFLELVQDEDGALVLVEGGERGVEECYRLRARHRPGLCFVDGSLGNLLGKHLVPRRRALSMVRGYTNGDGEEPAAERAPLKVSQLCVHDEKRFLASIVEVGRANAHALQRSPNERRVFGIDIREDELCWANLARFNVHAGTDGFGCPGLWRKGIPE
jgi:hypothetical protein